jgi:hypothetical protein
MVHLPEGYSFGSKVKQIDCWGLHYHGALPPMTTEETACYIARYKDLRYTYGVASSPANFYEGPKKHWALHGFVEGRSKSCEFKSKRGKHCSKEHGWCECAGNVYFGEGDAWYMSPSRDHHGKQLRGCAAWDFDGVDPSPGKAKECYCDAAERLFVPYSDPGLKGEKIGDVIPYGKRYKCSGTPIMVAHYGKGMRTAKTVLPSGHLLCSSEHSLFFPDFAPGYHKHCHCMKTPYIR